MIWLLAAALIGGTIVAGVRAVRPRAQAAQVKGVLVVNQGGDVVEWDSRAESLTGVRQGQILGRNLPLMCERKEAVEARLRISALRDAVLTVELPGGVPARVELARAGDGRLAGTVERLAR